MVGKNRALFKEEILIEAVAQFKRAIEEAKMQVLSNQELSLTLSNELRLKQRLLDEEQKTTDKLIQVSLSSIFEELWTWAIIWVKFKLKNKISGQKRFNNATGRVTRAYYTTGKSTKGDRG